MRALDRKLLRDFVHIWAQALALALVCAAGVATLVLAVGAYRSLEETRSAYYERYLFAHVFASATRVPRHLVDRIGEIPGVSGVEARIVEPALLDIEGYAQPATGLIVSLPEHGEPALNRLYLRKGRLPQSDGGEEVAISESFANAQGFELGDTFDAIMHGAKRTLTIVGVALSPEYVYAVGPGDFVPDDKRFGILWMTQTSVEAAYDLEGAFNNLAVGLHRSASEQEVIRRIDDVLADYGGRGAYGRKDQFSHAFLDAELEQLSTMARILPPIFLLVTVFLVNMILTRLVALEREQIGLLKALGYSPGAIAGHYLKLMGMIAIVGVLIGWGLGTWLGYLLTRLYGDFYHFPFLVFRTNGDIYVISGAVCLGAALLGALRAVMSAVRLPPAVAMQPPSPPRYRRFIGPGFARVMGLSQISLIVVRNLIRQPLRSAVTSLGVALSVAVLIVSLFGFDAVDVMLDVSYFQLDRQDATINFGDERPLRVVYDVANLPGVTVVEPVRTVATRFHNGQYSRSIGVSGRSADADLSRLLDVDLKPVTLPTEGLAITEKLAQLLHLARGDFVWVEVLEGRRRWVQVRVVEVFQSYVGLSAYMEIGALNSLLREGAVVNRVNISFDEHMQDALFEAVKNTPALNAIALLKVALKTFRETMAENILFMMTVYTTLGVIIAFGVVYNSARIQLSERGREMASLRVLGFTRNEVARLLTSEIAILTLIGIPVGWVLGYGFAWLLVQGFDQEVYRVPFVIDRSTYGTASVIVLVAVFFSIAVVWRRVRHLDMIRVLKTRE